MTFELTKPFAGYKKRDSITCEEFEKIRQAKECILEVICIEEKFDFLMGNFRDLEVGLLTLTTDDMLFGEGEWSRSMDERNLVSRLVGNLQSSCRMYLDHLGHHLSGLFGADSEQVNNAKKWASEEYDANFAYRFMEALRNHTQHRGAPVHWLSYECKHPNEESTPRTEFLLHLMVDVGLLRSDKKFKSNVIMEIDACESIVLTKDGGLALKPLIREYIQSIGRIHGRIRSLFDGSWRSWELSIAEAIERFLKNTGSKAAFGIMAAEIHTGGSLQQSIPLSAEFARRRQMFVNRNPITHHQSVRIATGRTS